MARDFGPFPTKPMYEVVNRRMQKALAEASTSTGFVKTGQGAVTAGTGAQLVIAPYPDGALVDGLWVENPTSETVTLTTNTASTNPRIDRLVMRLDMSAQTIAPFQIVGTPAASPQAPPLVQTATVFDMPLCRYTMPGSGSAQNPGSIIDERVGMDAVTSFTATPDIPGIVIAPSWVVNGLYFARRGGQLFIQGVAGRPSWVYEEVICLLPVGWRPARDTEMLARIGTTYYILLLNAAGELKIFVDNSAGTITASNPDVFAVIGTPCLLA